MSNDYESVQRLRAMLSKRGYSTERSMAEVVAAERAPEVLTATHKLLIIMIVRLGLQFARPKIRDSKSGMRNSELTGERLTALSLTPEVKGLVHPKEV